MVYNAASTPMTGQDSGRHMDGSYSCVDNDPMDGELTDEPTPNSAQSRLSVPDQILRYSTFKLTFK